MTFSTFILLFYPLSVFVSFPLSQLDFPFDHPPFADHFHLLSFLYGSPIISLPFLPSLFLQLFQAMYLIFKT